MNDLNLYLRNLENLFREHGNPADAEGAARYMKNHFAFFGVKAPLRRTLVDDYVRQNGLPEGEALIDFCRRCNESAYREMHYVVGDLLAKRIKTLDERFLDLFEELIGVNSWWDTVDFLAPKLMGGLLLRFPAAIPAYTDRWIESENIWYQRSAILFQLHYKHQTDEDRLFRNILRRADSNAFFVQKGAGWALREYGKIQPQRVAQFVASHTLPALTVREGMRRIRQADSNLLP